MPAGGIPEDVQRLIDEHIHSVEQLEVLLLLKRETDRAWTADAVSKALVTHPDSVAARLDDLVARALARRSDDGYRYAPGRHDGAVDGLAEAYARRRVSVISSIFGKPSDAIRSFSDAFRLRRDR